jgi:hypothetical protein
MVELFQAQWELEHRSQIPFTTQETNMSSNALSAAQGGEMPKPYRYAGVSAPKGLGSVNATTQSKRTAWTNDSDPYGTPQPLSKQTQGSYYKWDDGSASQPSVEKK